MKQATLVALAGVALTLPGAAWAQGASASKFPERPVRIVVGFGPGGGTDLAARAIGQKLTEAFGASFIIDNRPGAAGNLAGEIVARSNPDGYTLLMANSTIAIPSLSIKLPFDVRKDFQPLSLVALGPSVLVVNTGLPATDVKGFVALARAKPNQLTFGSGGVGNVTHLAMELLMSSTGIQMVHIPYKGGLPSVIALMGGEVQSLFTSIPTALPQVNAGKMRALGVSIAKRSSAMPNVPTIAESIPGYYAASWYGLLLPAGVPKPVVNALAKEISAAMEVPAIRDGMLKQGFEPVGNTPEEFRKFIGEEIPRWEKVVKNAGIKPE